MFREERILNRHKIKNSIFTCHSKLQSKFEENHNLNQKKSKFKEKQRMKEIKKKQGKSTEVSQLIGGNRMKLKLSGQKKFI